MKKSYCIFSFFAGSGFLDLGFELSGFKIAYINEIFSPFMQAYRYSRKCLNLPLPEYGYSEGEEADVTRLTAGEAALKLRELMQDARKNNDIIGFIAGPPCPDFSVGGKNRGQEGEKGKLSAAYVELICQQQPDFFLFENVKGLWRTQKHRVFFEECKNRLNQAGYVLTERLINAIEYGVPQDRDRIILLGFRKDLIKDRGIKLDEVGGMLPEGVFPWNSQIIYPKSQAFAYSWPSTNSFEENSLLPCANGIPQELTVEFWFQKNDVMNHPNAEHCFKPKAGIKRFAVVDEGDDSRKSFKRLHRWRYSPTACYGNNEVHLHPYKVRRLSVAEVLAIQSLPKEFVLPASMTLSNMFKTVGNGVPFLAAKGIAKSMIEFWERSEYKAYSTSEYIHSSLTTAI
ncbi:MULTISPECIES: DNA cytosine methyltransferase [Kamptonema]|uniref:DNA cytosine methyltransferase n=1 Tax=Kamptonema TaxID=1501433 RepID=UPI0001DACE51|nr:MULTISPECIES: DNA cytosine methyltransferase [Kamptonema]CBN58735.1 putative modification methylase NmeDIP [Kamptonema sp. PCC 6506]